MNCSYIVLKSGRVHSGSEGGLPMGRDGPQLCGAVAASSGWSPDGVAGWHFHATRLPYRCAGDANSSLARGERQDTLSATALPSKRPVALPTVWETASAGH